jgi:CHASE3 domain sensor protein
MKPDDRLLEVQRLIGKVAERHGIRIDPTDPAFYVLSLNEFALNESTKIIAESIGQAVRDFQTAADRVQQQAGSILAEQIRQCVAEINGQLEQATGDYSKKMTQGLDQLDRIRQRFSLLCILAASITVFWLLIFVFTRWTDS